VQGSVTPVIVVDIGVSAGAIDVILETLPVLTEVGDGCLFGALFAAELAVASLILIHCEHVLCWEGYLLKFCLWFDGILNRW